MERFSMYSRSVVMAVLLEKGITCTNCGTAPWEWEEDPDAFVAVEHECRGCAVKDRARSAEQNGSRPGVTWRLVPRRIAALTQALGRRRPASPRERSGR